MEYYSALKRNGSLLNVTIWIKLEDIMLRKFAKRQILSDSTDVNSHIPGDGK